MPVALTFLTREKYGYLVCNYVTFIPLFEKMNQLRHVISFLSLLLRIYPIMRFRGAQDKGFLIVYQTLKSLVKQHQPLITHITQSQLVNVK